MVLRTLYIIMYPSDTLLSAKISDFKQKKTGDKLMSPVILIDDLIYLINSIFLIPIPFL